LFKDSESFPLQKSKRSINKDDLIEEANILRSYVQKEIDKLNSEGKNALAIGLEVGLIIVASIEQQASHVNPDTELGKLFLTELQNSLKKAKKLIRVEMEKLSNSSVEK
jgi:hypothetical protein